MIVHEVAATIKKNSKKYAHLFTTNPNKKQKIHIEIPLPTGQEDWFNVISQFKQEVDKKIPHKISHKFIPRIFYHDRGEENCSSYQFLRRSL